MKHLLIFLLLMAGCGTFLSAQLNLSTSVKSGVYIPNDRITRRTLNKLPVPKGSENYALLQCIHTECNIVTGEFMSYPRQVTLYKDKNNDGKVDQIISWNFDEKRYSRIIYVQKKCPPKKFKQMKEDILNGKTGDIYPNKDAIPTLLKLAGDPNNIRKWKNGFSVKLSDPDLIFVDRLKYSVSDNGKKGVDAVFYVKYRYERNRRVTPPIRPFVYCKNSKDPLVKNKVQELIKKIKKNYIDTKS